MSPRQLLGLAGAAMIALGVFSPFVSLPIVGSVSYFLNGKGDGTIVLFASIVAGVMILAGHYRPAGLVAAGILLLAGVTAVLLERRVADVQAQAAQDLQGNPFAGLAANALETVQLQWGFGLIVVGAMVMIVAAFWDFAVAPAAVGS